MKTPLSILLLLLLMACCKEDEPIIVEEKGWHTVYKNDELEFITIKFLDKNQGYFYASTIGSTLPFKYYLYFTTNGGKTWAKVGTYDPWTVDVSKIFPLSKNVLLGTGYHVHKSVNNGISWYDLTPRFPMGPSVNDLHIIDCNDWLILWYDDILRTTNAGQSWQEVFHTDTMAIFNEFSFPSVGIGYASIGYKSDDGPFNVGHVLKTVNGGQNWTILKPEPFKSNQVQIPYIKALQFVTDQIGYMATDDNKLYKTLDGGMSWALIREGHYAYLQHFISESCGYYTNRVRIYKTNDGGVSWSIDYSVLNLDYGSEDITAWTFLESGECYAVTRGHKIIKLSN